MHFLLLVHCISPAHPYLVTPITKTFVFVQNTHKSCTPSSGLPHVCGYADTPLLRGPAKGYIEGLEHRLHEAESLLLALLPVVTSSQLACAADTLNSSSPLTNVGALKTRDSQSPGPRNVRSSPPVLNKKTGIDYWESFPLDSAENIRRWQEDCATHSTSQHQSSFRTSSEDLLFHTTPVHQGLDSSARRSRPASIEVSRHNLGHKHSHSQSGAFRSMSTDSYRSGASTPVNGSHSIPTSSGGQQHPHSRPQKQQQPWPPISLFSPVSRLDDASSGTPNPHLNGGGIGAEALLLQSFADSSWAQTQSLNGGLGGVNPGMGTSNNAMGLESGPMEIDTGFFTNDLQRRLFW